VYNLNPFQCSTRAYSAASIISKLSHLFPFVMHVLISGAGIAGPTLAWFLAKTGARITILEKSKVLLPHGQNVDIQGSAVTAIRKMGLLDEVRRHNTKETGTQFIGPNGNPFAAFPVSEGSSASLTSEFEILRGDLAAVLYRATKSHPNISYMFDTTVKSVLTNDDKSVRVELSNGEKHEYDLLVAADGQWSRVRKQCFVQEAVKATHMGMYAVYFTVPRLAIDNDLWNIYIALGSRIVAVRPDPHGKLDYSASKTMTNTHVGTVRAMFTLMPNSAAQENEWRDAGRSDRKTQRELLGKEFANAGWQSERLLGAVDSAPDFYFHVIEQIKMSKWSTNRVICLGDTAYAPTPLTGMGTSLAIIGAYMLAGELSKLEEGEHPSKAFDAYEDKFRPYVEKSQEIPPFVPAIMHPRTAWKRWLLQSVVSGISKIVSMPWVQSKLGDPSNDEDFPLPHYPGMAVGTLE
jgi:2-polyprenyl-6-methoxyphenol hydroxylase-like FAD-dependent oxidoreductase